MAQTQVRSRKTPDLTREQARKRLKAAGLLAKLSNGSDEIKPLSDVERSRLGALLAKTPSSEAIVDDDRGPA